MAKRKAATSTKPAPVKQEKPEGYIKWEPVLLPFYVGPHKGHPRPLVAQSRLDKPELQEAFQMLHEAFATLAQEKAPEYMTTDITMAESIRIFLRRYYTVAMELKAE